MRMHIIFNFGYIIGKVENHLRMICILLPGVGRSLSFFLIGELHDLSTADPKMKGTLPSTFCYCCYDYR